MFYDKKPAKLILTLTLITTIFLTLQTSSATRIEEIEGGIIIEPGETFELEIPADSEPDYIRTKTQDGIEEIEKGFIDDFAVIEFEVDSEIDRNIFTIETILFYEETDDDIPSFSSDRYITVVGIGIPSTGIVEDIIQDLEELQKATDEELEEQSSSLTELFDEMENIEKDVNDLNQTLTNIQETMETLIEETDDEIAGVGNIILRSSKYLALLLFIVVGYFALKKYQEEDDDYVKPTDFSP